MPNFLFKIIGGISMPPVDAHSKHKPHARAEQKSRIYAGEKSVVRKSGERVHRAEKAEDNGVIEAADKRCEGEFFSEDKKSKYKHNGVKD